MRGQSDHAQGCGGRQPASSACQCVCLCVRVDDGAEGVQVQGALKDQQVAAVACGEEFTVAITAERGVFVWGLNNVGQLGGASQEEVADSPIHLAALRDRQVLRSRCFSSCTLHSPILASRARVAVAPTNGHFGSRIEGFRV